jgi:type IV pilus assembly protein PilQ
MKNITLTLVAFCLCCGNLFAQDKYLQLQEKLVILASGDIPALNERVNISVTDVPIQEFLRGIANSSSLNINVDPELKINVVNNFSNVKVVDILLFLCRQYDLNITVIGNIINVFKNKTEIVAPPPPKALVGYDTSQGLLSIQCENEDLMNVTREMVDKSGLNVVLAPGLDKVKVTGYIQNMLFDNALDKFAFANNLKVRKTDDNVYLVEKTDPPPPPVEQQTQTRRNTIKTQGSGNFLVKKFSEDSLAVSAQNASITDIIQEAAAQLKADYFFTSPVQGEATFNLKSVSFPSLLEYLFRNSNYTYQNLKGIFLIGEGKSKEMKEFRIIQLQNRTIEKLLEAIPADLKSELDVKEFPELNALLVGGLSGRINVLENFLKSLDKLVPVILIEVIIIDYKKTHTVSTGIELGLGNKPAVTQGSVFPGVNLTLSSQSINNLLNSFNGFGSVKLGSVTPNFYANLSALESNGIVNIRSTPKLSALNGHEATLKIGNTKYYREQQSNIYGTLSAQSTIIETFKPIEANLSLKIKPVVSGEDQITLDIEVKQEDFTDQIKEFAPYNKESREFKSLIRVKNQEMVLLGGLEQKSNSNTGSGVPLLSRIPIIKWLFSSKKNDASKTKLNIFIKPTIID